MFNREARVLQLLTAAGGLASGLVLGIFALVEFVRRANGKGYVASSAVFGVGSIFSLFMSTASTDWITVGAMLLSGGDATAALAVTQRSWIEIAIYGSVACVASVSMVLLAKYELNKGKLPLNASAVALQRSGAPLDLSGLAIARIRYALKDKADRPIATPGDDPFALPPVAKPLPWPMRAIELLVVRHGTLQRDTLKPLREQPFMTLMESDPLAPRDLIPWVVLPVADPISDSWIIGAFEKLIRTTSHLPPNARLVACVKSNATRDETLLTAHGRFINVLSEASLLETGLDFTNYISHLLWRFGGISVPGTEFTVEECFVEPHVIESMTSPLAVSDDRGTPPLQPTLPLLPLLREWSNSDGTDHLSLVGEFGQGKSTAVLAFCAEWARKWSSEDRGGRIPLLIELRGKSPRRQSPEAFLSEWGNKYALNGSALLALIKSGRALLIFEGFDELQEAGLAFNRFEQFKALWAFSYPNVKILFTGRPNFFLDTGERSRLLRSSTAAKAAGLVSSRLLSLCFLREDEIQTALRAYPENVREEIARQCEQPAFLDIARRPSMLPVVASQWREISTQLASSEGLTTADVISFFIDFLYQRKEDDPFDLGSFQLLHRDIRHYFTQRIVWAMVQSDSQNTIQRSDFDGAIASALDSLDEEFRMNEGDPVVASAVRELQARFAESKIEDYLDSVATDVRTNGLFAPDPAGGKDNLYLPHKQYYEFLIAQVFAKAIRERASAKSWAARIPVRELARSLDAEPNALFFASGILNEEELRTVARVRGLPVYFLQALSSVGATLFAWVALLGTTIPLANAMNELRALLTRTKNGRTRISPWRRQSRRLAGAIANRLLDAPIQGRFLAWYSDVIRFLRYPAMDFVLPTLGAVCFASQTLLLFRRGVDTFDVLSWGTLFMLLLGVIFVLYALSGSIRLRQRHLQVACFGLIMLGYRGILAQSQSGRRLLPLLSLCLPYGAPPISANIPTGQELQDSFLEDVWAGEEALYPGRRK